MERFVILESDVGGILAIILSIIGVIVVAGIVAFILLNNLVLKRNRCKKQLKEIQSKYEYLHALLTGQDAQYIQRLEIISRTNLLYSDIHSNYFRRSKEIRDTTDLQYYEIISELQVYLEERRINDFKNYLKEHQGIMKQYEDSVNQLNNDLVQVIRPEEDCRQAALIVKEKYRDCKSKYNSNENKLVDVVSSFDKVFDTIDQKFNEFESDVEQANYDEANILLPKIETVVSELNSLIDEIPPLFEEFSTNIPSRIDQLTDKYNSLVLSGIPLKQLRVEDAVSEIQDSCTNSILALKKLSVNGLKENKERINKIIDEIYVAFDKEVDAHSQFDTKNQEILDKYNYLSGEYIKITNNISRFKKVYVIDSEHLRTLEELGKFLDVVSKDKRRLDVYIHSVDPYPYSLLIDKLLILEKGTNELNEKVVSFETYLSSLKNDCEVAFNNLITKYRQLKESEFLVVRFKIADLEEKYKSKFDECYALIDSISKYLKAVPINVSSVNDASLKLNELTNNLVKEIHEIDNYKNMASEQILLANRDRMKFAEINNLVSQAETLYLAGDFKSAFEISEQVLEKLNQRETK
ncbi:MAG: hypothetical protein IJ186_03040 [Bacilli bacterium]|nr:hypothetical protein [Bacilli bacterium]